MPTDHQCVPGESQQSLSLAQCIWPYSQLDWAMRPQSDFKTKQGQ